MTFPMSGYQTIHELLKNILQQYSKDLGTTQSAIAGAIVGAIAEMNIDSELKILKLAKQPSNREELLTSLSMTNHRKNYKRYMLPMIENGWLTMTIPNKQQVPNNNTSLPSKAG